MWLIVGTSPQLAKEQMIIGSYDIVDQKLKYDNDVSIGVTRGTEALAAAASVVCSHLGTQSPQLLCTCDYGDGEGSKNVYAYLTENLAKLKPRGLTFHYLFPDVDWHNKILIAIDELRTRPTLVADAGFMYVAKMSGYADKYQLFTPDIGELSFLADELAPHPFYTRGFLLQDENAAEDLLKRAKEHNNIAQNLIIKGHTDYVVIGENIVERVSEPRVAAMEAIGGTGDLVTGIVTGLLASDYNMQHACTLAVKTNRMVAKLANPTPATNVGELIPFIKEALEICMNDYKLG